jgi:mRNA interferase MazF
MKKAKRPPGATSLAMDPEIRRGDVLWICCDPSVGAEPKQTRTCVVVSNDIANRYGQAVTVIPTQEYTRERSERAYVVDLRKPRSTLVASRVANASMIMTYDKSRVVRREGRITKETMQRIDAALCVHLGLEERPDER